MKTTKQVVSEIENQGGFTNFNNWNKKEIAEWVFANCNCSKYVAKQVSELI
jgi:hypothetical protein